MRRFHSSGRKLDAPTDLVAQVACDMPAHQCADGLADRSVVDRAFHISKFGIETLRISNRKQQGLRSCQGYQFIRFGEFERDRLLEKNMLARQKAFLGHWVVRGFWSRGNNN